MRKELSTQDPNGRPGQKVGACRGRGAGGTAESQPARPGHDVILPETLWRESHLSYSLLGHPGLGACVLQIPAKARPHLCVHYHCQNLSLFRAGWGQASLCVVAMGRGCCFSKSYLLCLSSSFVPFMPPILLLCFPPTSPSLPSLNFWKAHLQYLCSLWDGSSRFTSCFICKSCGFFVFVFFSFLSLSEKVVAAFLS